jgi:hypothetical protein
VKSEEFPQRARRYRRERLKFKDLAGVETVRGGSSFIYERQQRSDRLVDTVPLLRSLMMTGTRLVGLLSLGKRLDKAHMWATLGARFVEFAPRHGLYLYRAFMLAGLC